MENIRISGDEMNLILELTEKYSCKTADDLLDALKQEFKLLSDFKKKV